MTQRTLLCLSLLVASAIASAIASAVPARASAQDRAVVARLVELGRMPERDARDLVRAVSDRLAENARTGGDRYDRVRQAVGRAMFDGPGHTREEYEQRLAQVLERMRRGLDEAILERLFPDRPNSAALCANDFGLTMTQCDALVASASRHRAALPYTAPDDGAALKDSLRGARVRRREMNEIATKLRDVMLGVPRNLSRDERGRGLIRLLERCPGALTTRESQIRAWHVGPTEGMARCIAQTVARGGSRADAVARAESFFGLSSRAAEAFLDWGAPAPADTTGGTGGTGGTGTTTTPTPTPEPAAPTVSSEDLLAQGRSHFRAGRLRESATAYEGAIRIDPTNARAFAGLGSARLRMRDARAAVNAYRQAVALEPGNANFHAFLGEALAASGDRDGSATAYQQALALQPNNFIASQGLSRLGAQANQRAARRAPREPQRSPAEQANVLREQGRVHFAARRFPQAAAAYEQAARLNPSNAGGFAGLGAARLSMGDTVGAVSAYQDALRIDGNRSAFWSALARAQAQSGDRDGAVASLQRAVQLDPNNQSAQNGLRALGVTASASSTPAATVSSTAGAPTQAAGETMPETPSRQQIIDTMRPLQSQIRGCAPGYSGRATFTFIVTGASGMVGEASVAEEDMLEPAEIECMVNVVKNATFPHFTRETLEIAYPYAL